MKNLIDLTNKTILITGASSGIGKSVAETLANVGAKCILVARRENNLKKIIEKLSDNGHNYYCFDLSKTSEIENLVKKIVSENGPIDGMVYCAGVSGTHPIKVSKPEYLQEVMKVNFFSYYELIRCVSKKGNYANTCRIVGISSIGARYPGRGQSVYSASKAAMDAATRALASELYTKGIYLNTVRPGQILTEMYQSFYEETGMDYMEKVEDRQFLGIGQPEDVAGMVAYLLSPVAKFITGQCISVDGGYTSH